MDDAFAGPHAVALAFARQLDRPHGGAPVWSTYDARHGCRRGFVQPLVVRPVDQQPRWSGLPRDRRDGLLGAGLAARRSAGGKASLAWGVLPFTAGLFDVCYISAVLGGPLRGIDCRTSTG